ncbi:Metallo-dependent hydrolase [Phialemonium atrogriseum]|uniref:Metallo-dependent hydrolase n=1 Tax=Phialemonium atrogriseum TaxID=1093897 RepID=A0AAJ0C6U8_9PEZI|nr:Metallo-dependent hydrolase [Phialemonium atrogriseum]KAK1771234.1 Metallo-dependent hydrolase [Phialemonium atrogriseum]
MPAFTDEEWEEVSQELPAKDDVVIQKYLEGRQALIDEEGKKRSDFHFRQSLSPIARKACEIIARIRDEEMSSLAGDTTEQTRLWKIIRKMPKGALLHAHLDAMVDVDYILEVLLNTPGIHIWCEDSHLATAEARETAPIVVRFKEKEHREGSIWREDYVPGTPILFTQAANDYPGGKAEFLKWLKTRCTVSETATVSQRHELSTLISNFLYYEPVFRAFLRQLMSTLYADGISWIELRFTPPPNYSRKGTSTPETDHDHLCQAIDETISSFAASPDGRGFWGLRLIWASSPRQPGARALVEDMDACIAAKLAWPHLIAGYDLADPGGGGGRPLADALPELFWFRKQCASEDVSVPFYLTAGDTDLFDALLLDARRIAVRADDGGGGGLHTHPSLAAAVRDRRVLVETCYDDASSSTGGVVLPALLAHGVPCCLGLGNNKGIVSSSSSSSCSSNWLALCRSGWRRRGGGGGGGRGAGMDLAALGSLAENSVRWAALGDGEDDSGGPADSAADWAREVREASLGSGVKARRLREWAVAWEGFCLWVVTEFGGEEEDVDMGVAGAEGEGGRSDGVS